MNLCIKTIWRILLGCLIAGLPMGHAYAEPNLLGADTIKLTRIQGEVLVNVSGKYQITTVDTLITPDTKILLRQQSRAELIFSRGCKISLEGGKIYQAGTESDCKQGMTRVVADNETNVAPNKPNAQNITQAQDTDYLMLGAGAALVIGGAALAHSSKHDTQSPNASP